MAATLGPGETENGFVSAYAYGATASIACNNIDHDGAILRLVRQRQFVIFDVTEADGAATA